MGSEGGGEIVTPDAAHDGKLGDGFNEFTHAECCGERGDTLDAENGEHLEDAGGGIA